MDALDARCTVTREQGRWVLWLEVLMIPDRDDFVVRHRIRDFATERDALVAARWTARAARRDLPHPPLGS